MGIAPPGALPLLCPKVEKLPFFKHKRLQCAARGTSGGDVSYAFSSVIFKNVFDEYTFSIISNPSITNSYVFSTHKSKMCERNASYRFSEKNLELGAKF